MDSNFIISWTGKLITSFLSPGASVVRGAQLAGVELDFPDQQLLEEPRQVSIVPESIVAARSPAEASGTGAYTIL